MDALDSVFRSVRLSSSALFRARYGAPWRVYTQQTAFPLIHAVVEGHCHFIRPGCDPVRLDKGSVIVLPTGLAHDMGSDDDGIVRVPIGPLLAEAGDGVGSMEYGGPGPTCRIICGSFAFDHDAAQWLMKLMPSQMVLKAKDPGERKWLESTLDYLDAELTRGREGSEAVVARLIDLLVLQSARQTVSEGTAAGEGWVAALRDERVGRALAMMHSEPGADWTMPKLATACGMSRSRFFERFSTLVGEPPARYLARWRASVAADLIRREDTSTAEVAVAVGYGSEQAFTAAFRRHVGVSPSAFRRQVRHSGAA